MLPTIAGNWRGNEQGLTAASVISISDYINDTKIILSSLIPEHPVR